MAVAAKIAKLRPATAADLDVVASWITTPRDCEAWVGPLLAFPLDRSTLARCIGFSAETSFCLDERDVVAFGQLLDQGFGCGHLARIIVAPDRRRAGFGSRLVSALLERAVHCGFATVGLNVRWDNPGAGALYRQLGFRPAERPSHLAPAPGAEYLMRELPTD